MNAGLRYLIELGPGPINLRESRILARRVPGGSVPEVPHARRAGPALRFAQRAALIL